MMATGPRRNIPPMEELKEFLDGYYFVHFLQAGGSTTHLLEDPTYDRAYCGYKRHRTEGPWEVIDYDVFSKRHICLTCRKSLSRDLDRRRRLREKTAGDTSRHLGI